MSDPRRLAIDGGSPARERPDSGPVAALGASLIGDAERAAADAVLRDRVLYRYHGARVAELETRFAAWLGDGGQDAPNALAVNSGSSAIQLALAAAGVGQDDEVIVPTIGFVSAATAVVALGARPRFVPCDRTLGFDAAAAEALAGDATRALLAVHPLGSSCDLEAARRIATGAGARVVEDVAQACGARLGAARLGTSGDLAAFSFQQFKLIATGEGGMVVSANPELLDRARFSHDAASWWTMPDAAASVNDAAAPANLRMSELEGAIGLVQLERCDGLIETLRRLNGRLREAVEFSGRFELRPERDLAGSASTHLVFDTGSVEVATWAARALRAEGVRAGSLIGEPAGSRHWAGDWGPILERCGADPPDADAIARDRDLLGGYVVVQVDPLWSERDVEQTATALGKMLDAA